MLKKIKENQNNFLTRTTHFVFCFCNFIIQQLSSKRKDLPILIAITEAPNLLVGFISYCLQYTIVWKTRVKLYQTQR
jgi:hypothetical protein